MSWNVSLPRMVTWGLFEVKEGGKRFYFFNTHYPHRAEDAEARVHCTEVLMQRLAKLPADTPVVLTGDFNSGAPDAQPYKMLSAELKDARMSAARREGPEGTNGGFRGRTTGARIDWIFFRGNIKPLESETIVRNNDGHYPSDHFPVLAVLQLQ
jgi:endonuclease/exonuclease/phosphatase family metal-dependent hydrolase